MASNYPTVYYGSYGETVKQLQQALNQVGYSLDVDGGFGEKTRAAVLDYQRKNGLRVDGVAGSETMGSLLARLTPATSGPSTSGQVLSGVSDETMSRMRQLEKGYTPSDEVTAARALWESLQGQKPGEYESRFQQQLAALYDQISSRKPYAYDPEQDADYQRYARLYQRQGQAAMEDTMGQAAALSGGYGSSYAQQTGQQAYSQYLSELSALIPELEKQARSRYEQQGQALMDRYGLLQQAEQVDYSRWQDQLKAWQSDSDRAYEYYNSVGKEDRDLYSTMLKYYAGKAADEQKAAGGVRYGSGRTVEGQRYHVDATFDNSLQRGMKRYDYFNLDDRHIFRDHQRLVLPLPECSGDKGYFYRSLSFTKTEDVEKRVRQALRKKQEHFVFHWRGGGLNQEILGQLLEKCAGAAAERGKTVGCSLNRAQAVIQLDFSDAPAGEVLVEEPDEGQKL